MFFTFSQSSYLRDVLQYASAVYDITCVCVSQVGVLSKPGMLTRPAGHEAKAKAEARKSEAEDEAENVSRRM